MVTIKDIAREAGVSVTSVSRFFNNRRLLSAESCSRIEAVVEKYGYTLDDVKNAGFYGWGDIFATVKAGAFGTVRQGACAAAHDGKPHVSQNLIRH